MPIANRRNMITGGSGSDAFGFPSRIRALRPAVKVDEELHASKTGTPARANAWQPTSTQIKTAAIIPALTKIERLERSS
jgi:hypothetical protein